MARDGRAARAALAGAVGELGHRELVGVHEQGRAALGPVGDLLAFLACPLAERRRARDRSAAYSGGGCWSKAARTAATPPAGSWSRGRSRRTEPGTWMSRNRAGSSPVTANACTTSGGTNTQVSAPTGARGPRAGTSARPRGREAPRRGACVDVERRRHARPGAARTSTRAELLDVGEERDVELTLAGDALAVADLDHRPAA